MWWRSLIAVSVLMAVIAGFLLVREKRSYSTTPAASAARSDAITVSNLYAGGRPPVAAPGPEVQTHEEVSSYDVSEGERLYHNFNCNTCHAEGGGDIGPPLMDDKWIYGAEPRNIFADIVEGRPNGMPSFRGKIPDAQVWQLVAYVRSMSGHVPFYAEPGRNNSLTAKRPESMTETQNVARAGNPSPDSRANTP